MEALRYTTDIPASPETVWDLFATEEGLKSWLCLRARVRAVPGGPYELFWNPDESGPESDSTLGCKVLSADRPRLLHVTWRGSDAAGEVMNAPGAPRTHVLVRLQPAPRGTRIELVHDGWGDGEGWEQARAWFDRAWTVALERLRAVASTPP